MISGSPSREGAGLLLRHSPQVEGMVISFFFAMILILEFQIFVYRLHKLFNRAANGTLIAFLLQLPDNLFLLFGELAGIGLQFYKQPEVESVGVRYEQIRYAYQITHVLHSLTGDGPLRLVTTEHIPGRKRCYH